MYGIIYGTNWALFINSLITLRIPLLLSLANSKNMHVVSFLPLSIRRLAKDIN